MFFTLTPSGFAIVVLVSFTLGVVFTIATLVWHKKH
jgi:hypothetical protein